MSLATSFPIFAFTLCSLAVAQAPGLRLFQPLGAHETQLVDNQGAIVHSWPGQTNLSAHILEDGTLLRSVMTASTTLPPGATGKLERLAFDGTLLWEYYIDGPTMYMHHDIEPMPNGNVLVIVWDNYTAADAIAAGRDPAYLSGVEWYPDAVLEIEPTGPTTANVVWEWHMQDHLIQDFDPTKTNYGTVASDPGLLDINYPVEDVADGDWNHFNGIDFDPINDWIILSARLQDEVYIIDHSTTTAEAAGHTGGTHGKGGDFLYRWGNPEAYRAGTVADRQLQHQHDPRFIPPGYPGAGNVTIFNNDYQPNQSAIFEIVLPIDPSGSLVIDPGTGTYGPTAPVWIYDDANLNSRFVSSAERMPNGNTLICAGAQLSLFEVNPAGQMVWTYVYPVFTPIFQAHYVERTLWNDTDVLPVGGGQVKLDRIYGSEQASKFFLMLGSVSGTYPGLPVPGGLTLPLNGDFLTSMTASLFNQGIFVNTIGDLDANGSNLQTGGFPSSLDVPSGFIPPQLAGTVMHFADIVYDNSMLVFRVSNPVEVTIVL